MNEIKSLIKKYVINKWQIEYNCEPKGKFYKSIQPVVSTDIKFMDFLRKREVQITRLRLGHILNNKWLKTIGKSPTDLCSKCQITETIEHLFFDCTKMIFQAY